MKHDEYADAGIPHYWIVDLDAVTRTCTTREPFPVELDLTRLTA